MKDNIILIGFSLFIALIFIFGIFMVKDEKAAENQIQYIVDKTAYEDSKFIEITIQIVKNDSDQEVEE